MRRFLGVAAASCLLAWAGEALARNPHCAGGIQYVTGAFRDKEKGNMEDYQRQVQKAIQQLNQCALEDPKDFEAMGYLGWIYAEADSAEQAGRWFDKAIAGLNEKGDKKKAEWAGNNRDSYYARYFNGGIESIKAAENAYPDMTKAPENSADETLRGEAQKAYARAEANLKKALALKPNDTSALRNLGLVYLFTGDYDRAEASFRAGVEKAPGDSALKRSLAAIPGYRANRFVSQAEEMFRKAQQSQGEERTQAFRQAGVLYAQAARVKPDDPDPAFNAGSAFNAGGQCDSAVVYLRRSLALRSDDADALSLMGGCLAEMGQYRDAIEMLHRAVVAKPKEKLLHRQLGAAYNKAGKELRSQEEAFFAVALQLGKPGQVSQAQATASKFPQSAAAQTLASMGPPEELINWEAEGTAYETWLYWGKKQALSFAMGKLVSKTDWSSADLQGLPAATAGSPK
jgi:Flp pilus assembly protein TadD